MHDVLKAKIELYRSLMALGEGVGLSQAEVDLLQALLRDRELQEYLDSRLRRPQINTHSPL